MGRIRIIAGIMIGKATRIALRLIGRSASYLPGKAALTICPDIIERISKPERIIAVTGTNGKTTVSNMLCDVLTAGGARVLDNRLGSNVAAGIAASLLLGVSIFNKTRLDVAVLEVDERSSARILPYIKPEFLVITNLFRDSIMRNAHPEYIAGIIAGSVPRETTLILNADEMISASIAPDNERVYYGIEETGTKERQNRGIGAERCVCPNCAHELEYEYRRYLHMGKVRCTECGYKSPEYDYAGVLEKDGNLTVRMRTGECKVEALSDNLHNMYNMVAVTAVMREYGLGLEEITAGLKEAKIVESRYNEDSESPVTVVMHLAKAGNPSANSRAFEYIAGKPGVKELILMNNLRDHKNWTENTCWLYDADFEYLNNDEIERIVLTGPRGKDYKMRLLLAGVSEEKLKEEPEDMEAAKALKLARGTSVYIMYGTDTIELARRVRDRVKEQAWARSRSADEV